jgi:hypothetical protein
MSPMSMLSFLNFFCSIVLLEFAILLNLFRNFLKEEGFRISSARDLFFMPSCINDVDHLD